MPKLTRPARLWVVLVANLTLVAALLAVGVVAHSVGVWAEGADYLTDAAAIGVALLALHLEAPTFRRPHGRPNATRFAAFANALWLLALTTFVAVEAVLRLINGVGQVHGLPVLVVSGVSAIVMLAGTLVLGGDVGAVDDGGALSMRAVLLDTTADAAAAAGVAVAGGVIFATGGLYWLDPAVALTIALVVAVPALRLLARIRAVSPADRQAVAHSNGAVSTKSPSTSEGGQTP